MEPIFDRKGKTVGWLKDEVIYDRANRWRAFIHDGNVFTYQGHHLGKQLGTLLKLLNHLEDDEVKEGMIKYLSNLTTSP